jgi:hypothetical protein
MFKEFSADGLSFTYPDDWSLEREEHESGWTVSLQSPGLAFAQVRLDRDMALTTEEVVQTTLEALREEYPKLDATPAIEPLAGEIAKGHDIEFFSLDAAVTCWTRCIYGPAGTVLVLCQFTSMDEVEYEPTLRALCASMRAEEEA